MFQVSFNKNKWIRLKASRKNSKWVEILQLTCRSIQYWWKRILHSWYPASSPVGSYSIAGTGFYTPGTLPHPPLAVTVLLEEDITQLVPCLVPRRQLWVSDGVFVCLCSLLSASEMHASGSCYDVTQWSARCWHSWDTQGRHSLLLCPASALRARAKSSALMSLMTHVQQGCKRVKTLHYVGQL